MHTVVGCSFLIFPQTERAMRTPICLALNQKVIVFSGKIVRPLYNADFALQKLHAYMLYNVYEARVHLHEIIIILYNTHTELEKTDARVSET